ncbi:MAG: hydrogenase maturation protease [Pseudomonadales bacterium]|nr:hydrogenase maturation protease [Pseudomonadales bacterium]
MLKGDTESKIKLLVYGIGNASRGDDALGPELLARLKQHMLNNQQDANNLFQITLEEAFQLQPEHIYDFEHQDMILFLDADARFSEGTCFTKISGNSLAMKQAYVSHALPPEQLLAMHESLTDEETPPAFALSMGAQHMELEEGLSEQAKTNLAEAEQLLLTLLNSSLDQWQTQATI